MIVTGWMNGAPNIKSGAGYGLRIDYADRDLHFNPDWQTVTLELDTGVKIDVNLSKAFWGKCPELRSKWIGKWMIEKGIAQWPQKSPPKMKLESISVQMFRLLQIE